MIPSKADIAIEDTMQGEEIQMGIDQKSLVFLQKVLTDLYADPELAVIREYSTNARDSHLEAGQTRPIEITTPNTFDPSLHIKDYGVGLSLEDIKTVYSLYGASTKRQNASANGMLGLGCKSALTYTNQFTIRSVKNGRLVIVMVTRDEFGAGAMKVVHNNATDEPNGVEIVIPAKSGNRFKEKAEEFFSFWERSPVPVLLNGEPPKFFEGSWVTDNIALVKSNSLRNYGTTNRAKVHMAGVTYAADQAVSWDKLNLHYGTSVIFFVEDGAVDFTPSREELHYTARTNKRLAECVETLRQGLMDAMQKDIDAQPTHYDAFKAYRRWHSTWGRSPDFVYRGTKPSGEIKPEETYFISRYGNNSYSDHCRPLRVVDLIMDEDNRVFVTGKDKHKITTSQRAKLRTWADNKGIHGVRFMFIDKDDNAPWTDHIPHVTWQEILSVKPAPNPNKTYSEPEHYVYSSGMARQSIDPNTEVDTSKPIAYAYLSDIKPTEEARFGHAAEKLGLNVYGVPKVKLKTFLKLYPQAKYYREAFLDQANKIFTSFTPKEVEVIKSSNSLSDIPRPLQFIRRRDLADTIEDPFLRDVVTLWWDKRDLNSANRQIIDRYNKWTTARDEAAYFVGYGDYLDAWNELDKGNEEYAKIGRTYPLLDNVTDYYHNEETIVHLITYINAVYNKENN